jgi:hypothetical protein
VLASYCSINFSSLTFISLSGRTETTLATFNCLVHIQKFHEVDHGVVVSIVFGEECIHLIRGKVSVTHIFQHFLELLGLNRSVFVFVVVFKGLNDLSAIFRGKNLSVLERNSVICSFYHIFFLIQDIALLS